VRDPLSLVAQRQGNMLTVVARGELDAAGAPSLDEAVEDAVAHGVVDVVVDCRDLASADAVGVGTLVAIRHRLEEHGGTLILFGPCEPVRRALEITGVETAFFVVGE
jgi:anti-anti-sigma factor